MFQDIFLTKLEFLFYLRNKTSVPVIYRVNKIWGRVRVRMNKITSIFIFLFFLFQYCIYLQCLLKIQIGYTLAPLNISNSLIF